MEKAQLGKSGLEVTRLCIGTWQASGWVTSNDSNFISTLQYALDQGINCIDTAEGYGNGASEELIAKAIKGRRDKVILASKFSHSHASPPKIRKALEGSLKRLQTDYLDLYQQHWPPPTPPLEESIAELELLKSEGKIRAIGVSNWMEPEWEELGDPGRIDSLQPCYSLLWRSIEKSVLPLCEKFNIGILAYSPLAQGILAGRIPSLKDVPSDFRKQNRLLTPQRFPQVLQVLEVLNEIADKYNKPLAAVAVRWILDHKAVSTAIVGASSSNQVDINLQALGWSLEAPDFERLSMISADLSKDLKPHDSLWDWHPRETGSGFGTQSKKA